MANPVVDVFYDQTQVTINVVNGPPPKDQSAQIAAALQDLATAQQALTAATTAVNNAITALNS